MGQTGRGDTIGYSLTLTGTITYLPIATVISIDGPGITVGKVEGTLLSSTFKPYINTLPEGEVSLTIEFDNADPAVIAFRALIKNAPVPELAFQLIYQDLYIDTFLALPGGFQVQGIENETRVTATLPLTLNTPPATTAPG
jgi:hypothetical protein